MNITAVVNAVATDVIGEMGDPDLEIRPDDLTGPHRWALLKPLRAELVRRLQRRGFPLRMIAPAFNRHRTSLLYWTRTDRRRETR